MPSPATADCMCLDRKTIVDLDHDRRASGGRNHVHSDRTIPICKVTTIHLIAGQKLSAWVLIGKLVRLPTTVALNQACGTESSPHPTTALVELGVAVDAAATRPNRREFQAMRHKAVEVIYLLIEILLDLAFLFLYLLVSIVLFQRMDQVF